MQSPDTPPFRHVGTFVQRKKPMGRRADVGGATLFSVAGAIAMPATSTTAGCAAAKHAAWVIAL